MVLLCLTLLSVSYTAAVSRLERLRLAVSHRRAATMLGVFTFAAVVILPSPLLACFVPMLYAAAWPVFSRSGMRAYRWAYSGTAATVACLVSSEALHTVPGMLALPSAVVVFMLVNLALVAVPIVIEHDKASLAMLAKPRVHAVVLGTQALGAALGAGMQWHPALGLLALPLLGALHKRVTSDAVVETEAWTDNTWCWDAWLAVAEETHRTGEWFSTVVIDLESGTIADAAGVLAAFLEPGDSIGRLGPHQLVMLLNETTARAARSMARLMATELRAAGMYAGVGSADSHQAATVQQMLVLASGDAVVQGANAPRSSEPV